MTHCCRALVAFIFAVAPFLKSATTTQAQTLNFSLTTENDVVAPGDRITYTALVANTGAGNLTNVRMQVQIPQFTSGAGALGETFGCTGGGVCTWTIGTMSPGRSRSLVFTSTAQASAPEVTITTQATASATGISDVAASVSFAIKPAPLLRLSLAPGPGPAAPGEPYTYTLTYGNVGSISPSNVVLRMPLPAGTTFFSVSDGGNLVGSLVTWNVGTVGVGSGGQVQLTVTPNEGLGDGQILQARAEIDPGVSSAGVTGSSAATPIRREASLRAYFAVSQTTAKPGDRITYTVTVANTGSVNLTAIAANFFIPPFGSGAGDLGETLGCTGGGICTWTIGTMSPGQNRSLVFNTQARGDAPQGELVRARVVVRSGEQQTLASQDVHIDPAPLLRLSLAPGPGPAAPGEPFAYTLTFGNVGTSSPTNVVLRLPLPAGTRFTSASGGGTLLGNVVIWNLGTLGVGSGGHVQLTVTPEEGLASGEVLQARAEIDSGVAHATVVRSSATTAIRREATLRAYYAVSQMTAKSSDRITYTITATNTGTVNLTAVSANLFIPPFASGAGALGETFGCTGGGICTWTIGLMLPGESRSLVFNTQVRGDAPQGEIIRAHVVVRSSEEQALAAQDVHIDPSPLLRLSLAPGQGPAAPGEPFTYILTFGNVGTSTPTDVVLRMPIPEGAEFDSATCGGKIEDGLVTWALGTLGPGAGGQFFLTVKPEASLPAGSVLQAHAELDPGVVTAAVVRSSAATAVGANIPLRISMAANRIAAAPRDQVIYELTASNEGAVALTGVSLGIFVPTFVTSFGGTTGFGCTGGGICTWSIGTLGSGESRTISLTGVISGAAPGGDIARTHLTTRATGSSQRSLQEDVLSGSLRNFSPSLALITSPEDGASLVLGGVDGEDPLPPETPFDIAWDAPCDPEGDPLTYRWQLSENLDFVALLMDAPSMEAGNATLFRTDFGTLAQVFSTQGTGAGNSVTLYHRAVASDGTNMVGGRPATIVLTRGALVDAEEETGQPRVFALYDNYPNPFNPTTTFVFDLPEPAQVELAVYDVVGRVVATVVTERLPAGSFRRVWNAGHLPSGTYLYQLRSGAYTSTRKLVLIK